MRRFVSPRAQRGFTLLEVLASFVVFALVFATTLQILSGALRNTQRSADYTEAALWAQTAMEGLGIEPPLEEGSYSGSFEDGYRWEIDIAPVEVETLAMDQPVESTTPETEFQSLGDAWEVPIDLYDVQLRIFWGESGDERMARFHTLRAVTPEAG